jgi:glycosyltransferase involved in cell wall biosynthesis
MDAVIVHSEHGAARLRELGVTNVHVIPHGPLDALTNQPEDAALPPELQRGSPTVLFFGLIRPYKGLDVLLEAWRRVEHGNARLWVVGMPRMPVRVDTPRTDAALRFVTGPELAATFRAADLVVLPYREIDQSGVLYTALAFGKPLLLSAVGGFPEVEGAELVAPGDADALAAKLSELLAAPPRPAAAATSWDEIARRTLELYAAVQT